MRLETQHVERLPRRDPEALALAYREMGDAAMAAEQAACVIDDVAWFAGLRPQTLHDLRIGPPRNKADILAVGLVGNR